MADAILDRRIATKETLDRIEDEIRSEVDSAAEWAEKQAECDPKDATKFTFVSPDPALTFEEGKAEGEEIIVDALNHALDEEMSRNSETILFGQDVAYGKGGVFTVTSGLTDRFGEERVFNAPLAESSIVGVSIGLATQWIKTDSRDTVW